MNDPAQKRFELLVLPLGDPEAEVELYQFNKNPERSKTANSIRTRMLRQPRNAYMVWTSRSEGVDPRTIANFFHNHADLGAKLFVRGALTEVPHLFLVYSLPWDFDIQIPYQREFTSHAG